MNFFDILHNNSIKHPDKIIWEDEQNSYSFSQIEDYSGRMYNYLKNKGIKKEDIVCIKMKRNANIYLVMLAVWKVGGAFVVIDKHSPQNYVEQILKDTNPTLIFDDSHFLDAITYPTLQGYNKIDEHDLACVVYSTGSSGVFKGAMHEYGVIQNIINKFEKANMLPLYLCERKSPRVILPTGFYSISAITEMFYAILLGCYYYVLPYEAFFDFEKYIKVLQDKEIEAIYIAPHNYLKLLNYDLPKLKQIDLTFDVTITDELSDKYLYSNSYALTESFGSLISSYIKATEIKTIDGILPTGKACPLTDIKIVDNADNKVSNNKIGELCFAPKYFRGYKNQKELTNRVYYNGYFHTGDLGYADCDGYYYVLGRKIDCILTDNGYIVPSLISAQIKKAYPNITKTYVKLFGDKNSHKIVVYYCSKKEYSLRDLCEKLKNLLPNFMLPTHLVKLDDFEYFPSGKINRLSFVEPN